MKKLIILPAVALLAVVGIFALGQSTKSAHAASVTPTVTQQTTKSSVTAEKPDTAEVNTSTSTNVKNNETSDTNSKTNEVENDGPGGHQDAQGAGVNHQFEGEE